jgi:hypothetical protein
MSDEKDEKASGVAVCTQASDWTKEEVETILSLKERAVSTEKCMDCQAELLAFRIPGVARYICEDCFVDRARGGRA